MAKLALLTTVALSRTDYVSVLCLYLTNKYGIHIQAAHACTIYVRVRTMSMR